jgi:3-dehydrosphinganine reductase
MFCCISLSILGVSAVALFLLNYVIKSKTFSLVGAHVLVTGGSSGIGKEIAAEAVRQGASVSLLARSQARLAEAKEYIERFIKDDSKQKVVCVSVDVSNDYSTVERAVQQVELDLGPVDVLVNSAGISFGGRFEEITLEQFKTMMDVNYFGSVFTTRAVVSQMKTRRSGRIVFLSSQAGQLGLFGYTGYSATKFALRGLAEALQMEVKPYNVRVCIAFPPDTDTPGLQEELKTKPIETKLISETSGLFQATDVARIILNDSLKGHYQSYMGLDGFMLSSLCSGMSPISTVWEAIIQVLTMGIFRAISLIYLVSFDRIVNRCQNEKPTATRPSQKDK